MTSTARTSSDREGSPADIANDDSRVTSTLNTMNDTQLSDYQKLVACGGAIGNALNQSDGVGVAHKLLDGAKLCKESIKYPTVTESLSKYVTKMRGEGQSWDAIQSNLGEELWNAPGPQGRKFAEARALRETASAFEPDAEKVDQTAIPSAANIHQLQFDLPGMKLTPEWLALRERAAEAVGAALNHPTGEVYVSDDQESQFLLKPLMDLQQELGMSNDNWREPQVVEKLRTALANYVSGGEAKLDGADIKKFLEQSVAATGKPHEYFVEDGKLSAALQVRHSRNVESGNFEEAKDLAATFGLELSASKKAATAAATERAVFTNMAKRGHELLAIEAARKGQLPDGFGQRPDVQEKFVSWVKENYEPYKSWKDIEVGEAVADMWYRHTLPRWPMNPTNLAYLDIWNLGEALGIPENIISGPVVKDVVERNIEAYTRRGIVKSDNWIVSEAKARLGLNGG